MQRAAKKSTLMQELARKVGHAAGRVVATTQELAESAAAMVSHDEASVKQPAKASSPTDRTPRKHSPRRAAKKAFSSSTTSGSKSKKLAVAKRSPREAAEAKSRKPHAASRG
jgi:hypothetical protein